MNELSPRNANIREFMNSLDNWLDNKIGKHNPFMKEWSYVFDHDDNHDFKTKIKFTLLIDIEGETNE